jgi:hypothetical protein
MRTTRRNMPAALGVALWGGLDEGPGRDNAWEERATYVGRWNNNESIVRSRKRMMD